VARVVGEVGDGPPPPKHPPRDATKTPLHRSLRSYEV
jgi:hypothetical protein